MVVMLDTPFCEVECKTTGYLLHSHVSPSLTLPCVTVCHQVSAELYHPFRGKAETERRRSCELFVYGDVHYVANSVYKSVLK